MRQTIAVAALALACFASPALAMTEAECTALFKKADVNSDGVLSDAEANRFLAAMRVANVTEPTDKRLASAAFMENCGKDVFKASATDAGAPLKGANSFTEGQAKDRAIARGYTEVTDLKKDDAGVWRGQATMDGKSVGVAIDFKGNVVSDVSPTMAPSTAPMPTTPAPTTTKPAPTTPSTPTR